MADLQTTTSQLKIDTYFVDGDTRVITLKNPRSNISVSDIQSLESYMHSTNIIVGDKMGATFGKIRSVTSVEKIKIDLDLT